MRAVLLSMVVGLVSAWPAAADDVLAYGARARYAPGSVVHYPDLRVVYRGERQAAGPGGLVKYRDFDVNTDCTAVTVSLAPDQRTAELDVAVGSYVLEVGGGRDSALQPDELIVWEKKVYDRTHPARKAAPARS